MEIPSVNADPRSSPGRDPALGRFVAFVNGPGIPVLLIHGGGSNTDWSEVVPAAVKNRNTADVVANAADTYLTGSALVVPRGLLQVGTVFRWRMLATKTAAGVAAPTWSVRVGAAGAVGDTARLAFVGPAQTAAVDAAMIEIIAIMRNVGAAGVLAGGLELRHNLAATGFSTSGTPVLQVTSGAFDTTPAGLVVGVSVDPGAAGVWTHQLVAAEMASA